MSHFLFAGFMEANLGNVSDAVRVLLDRGHRVSLCPGFDHFEARPQRQTAALATAGARCLAPARPRALAPTPLPRATVGDDPEQQLLSAVARRLYGGDFGETVRCETLGVEALAAELFATDRPHVVVVPEDTDAARGRIWALLARRAGIPCVAHWPTWYNLFGSYPLGGERLASTFLVFGRNGRERLLRAGARPERIVEVGSPFFESRRTPPPTAGATLPTRVLYASQDLDESPASLLSTLHAARDVVPVDVKLHPLEDPARYPWVHAALAPDDRLHAAGDLKDLLHRAAGVVTISSTIAFEALLQGKQVLLLRLDGMDDAFGLAPEGPVRVARNSDELRSQLSAIAAGELPAGWARRVELLQERLGVLDGRATERIVAAIEAAARDGRAA